MIAKYVYVVVLGAAVIGPAAAAKTEECNIAGPERLECGWDGIDEATCHKRNCCWDKSAQNAKFCYVKKGRHLPDGLCPIAPSERVECGYDGITKEQCLRRVCCWDDTVPDARFCFKQPEEAWTRCYIQRGWHGFCRYTCDAWQKKVYGMSECRGKICCYNGDW